MTTICCSRSHGEMAGDSRANLEYNFTHFPAKKVEKIGDVLVGASGRAIDCTAFMTWIWNGPDPENKPLLDSEDNGFQGLMLSHDGIFYFERDLCAMRVDRDFHAIGTGSQAALAALMLGKPPRRAVEIAAKIDSNTGAPFTVISLD